MDERIDPPNADLASRIARALPGDGSREIGQGLTLFRLSAPAGPVHSQTRPAFCVIAQGAKEVYLGTERYRYDSRHYFLSALALPVVSEVQEATPSRPYLSLRLELSPALVASVMLEAGIPSARSATSSTRALAVSFLDEALSCAAGRLVRLASATPTEVRILLPLVTREIVFRLLQGEQGGRLRQLAVLGSPADRIARALERLRRDFDKPLSVESLARELGMSASGFHEHFKAVTALSPLQFQKRLRLQEARRLLLGSDTDAATVAARVGYEDASHFSREYKRLFGQPPIRDTERLRSGMSRRGDGR